MARYVKDPNYIAKSLVKIVKNSLNLRTPLVKACLLMGVGVTQFDPNEYTFYVNPTTQFPKGNTPAFIFQIPFNYDETFTLAFPTTESIKTYLDHLMQTQMKEQPFIIGVHHDMHRYWSYERFEHMDSHLAYAIVDEPVAITHDMYNLARLTGDEKKYQIKK